MQTQVFLSPLINFLYEKQMFRNMIDLFFAILSVL